MLLNPKDLLILKIAVRNWQSLNEITATEAEELIKKIDDLSTETCSENKPASETSVVCDDAQ